MRITKIDDNCKKNRGFKALKIDANLALKLQDTSPEYLKSLAELGEQVANVKRFNVVLKDNLIPKIYAVDVKAYGHKDYFHELKQNIEPKLGKYYTITNGDESFSGYNPKVPMVFSDIYDKDKSIVQYENFCKLDELEQAAEYSKLLDQRAAIIEYKETQKLLAQQQESNKQKAELEEKKATVEKLINKFKLEKEETTAAKKKKWWQF